MSIPRVKPNQAGVLFYRYGLSLPRPRTDVGRAEVRPNDGLSPVLELPWSDDIELAAEPVRASMSRDFADWAALPQGTQAQGLRSGPW